DRTRDAAHPEKRFRPIASGRLPAGIAMQLAAVLSVLAVAAAMLIGSYQLAAVLLAYLAISHVYTFVCKHVPVIDVVTLGLLYALRFLAACVAVSVYPSGMTEWLAIVWLLAMAIGLGKRRSEVRGCGTKKRTRRTLEFYSTAAAPVLFYGTQVAVMALYLSS